MSGAVSAAATHQWAQLSTLNDCCTVCGTVAHGDAPGAPGIVYPTGPCRGANAGSSDGAVTDLTVKTFGAMGIGHDGTHVVAAIFDRGDGTAAMGTAAQAREWARAFLAAADAVDPPEAIADAQREPELLPTLQPIDPLYAASAELHEIASTLQIAGHSAAASIVLHAHRDVDALRDAVDPPVRDGAPREIESPETMGSRLVPSLTFRDHATHMDWVRTLRDTIRVRDKQIVARCEQHGFAAGREGDEQMTAYDLSTIDSNGLSNTSLRDRAMYCEGQASAFRAMAAKLRKVGR